MIEFLLSLSTWAGCGVMMAFTAVLGLLVYLVSHKLIAKYKSRDLKDEIGGLFRVVGMLVSLMLSLAFGEVIVELVQIKNAVEREVVAIKDVYKNLEMFDIEGTREIQATLIDYTQSVIDDDWPALANDSLGQRTTALERQLAEAVIRLKPASPIQEKLWSVIIADVDTMSDFRMTRLDNALAEPPVYVFVIIFGFVVTMACFGAYYPQAPVIALVFLYTIFVGLVLFLILTLSDPFQGDIGVSPASFENIVEIMQSKMG